MSSHQKNPKTKKLKLQTTQGKKHYEGLPSDAVDRGTGNKSPPAEKEQYERDCSD